LGAIKLLCSPLPRIRLTTRPIQVCSSFLFNAPAPTELYPLSLHDALPISTVPGLLVYRLAFDQSQIGAASAVAVALTVLVIVIRSEEHTSELQSRFDLVCRLLLEKKKHTEYILDTLDKHH